MTQISYRNFHFPPSIAQQTVWLYVRFHLSLGEVEELLAERGVEVSYKTIRQWVTFWISDGKAVEANSKYASPSMVCVSIERRRMHLRPEPKIDVPLVC